MAELRTAEVSGLAAVEHATALLQRMRLVSAVGGVWEAADIQWAWRRPSPANAVGGAVLVR
ncbi:hypothetical protein [Brevibacterium album]|uniref:hypothetical protein n=1 Tax=Brevibacterium album TaxID=417948 RepID=UPI00146FA661|nr:hypothetical protein [Brevibacterium album]